MIDDVKLLCGKSFFHTENDLLLLDGGTGINYEQLFGDLYRDYVHNNGYTEEELDNVCRNYHFPSKLSENEKVLRDHILEEETKRLDGRQPIPGCYPPGILLGSTWNKEVVYEVGAALGMEAQTYKVNCLLGTPNVNLLRDARNGRFFEGYSEDPLVAGSLGSQLVKGVQSQGVAANVKHFAANNLEINRSGIDQHISSRALRELYLPAFKSCVDAGVATIMTSYPSINGTPCVENKWLLTDVLRDEWKFEGVNMTDWDACQGDSGTSAAAGIDLFMPGPWSPEDIKKAYEEGRITKERIKQAADRMRELKTSFGTHKSISEEERIEAGTNAAYKAAAEGIVMLINKDCCPIEDNEIILFEDEEMLIFGGGSAQVFTSRRSELREHFKSARINDYEAWEEGGKTAIVTCSIMSAEGADRTYLSLPESTTNTLDRLSKAPGKIILVLNVPGPVTLGKYKEIIDACFVVYYPGSEGVRALADIIKGDVNPSGKLTCTWPERIEDMPSYLCYPDGFTSNYGEGIYVGYRGFQKRNLKPMFPFGFGLTYTSFDIKFIEAETNDGEVIVKVNVTNTGDRDGAEVIQLYVGDPVSRKIKPVKELRAFEKVFIEAGNSKEVTLRFGMRDLAAFDEDIDKFVLEDGVYEIYLGNSSEAEKVGEFRIDEGDEEYRLGINTPIVELIKHPELVRILEDNIRECGMDIMFFVMACRYTPAKSVSEVYDNAAALTDFISACQTCLKP